MSGGLYVIKPGCTQNTLYAGLANKTRPLSIEEIHMWLGHIAPSSIREMLKDEAIVSVTLNSTHPIMGTCDTCKYAKLTCKPIGKIREPLRYGKLGDEIHTDLWGPSPVQTAGHNKYYVSFMDNYMQYTRLYLLKAKSKTFNTY